MLFHLDSGTCASGMNRRLLNDNVRRLDRNNIITDPSRMIGGGDGTQDEVTYYATNAAWNGHGYECYLCHSAYNSLRALNQHLASPRHQNKIYFCPLQTCRVRFTTLSALCQHIESERCGVYRFQAVKNTLEGIVAKLKLTY
ncbi:hypothetical protein H0H81_001322 [Sphagnurus paluster]|uniref:C2H2-type domain-containing protein n=1 Tax=Sphagnurus paluster TaxID=117069 RepID=A0A9P7FTN4_9AGAR|nr:hypothetical protein H0H81_001322 [Sphagnurus paluster]